MATKRTRRGRNLKANVTTSALEHFREALPLRDRYIDCLNDEIVCPRRVHCPECTSYLEHRRALYADLHLHPWEHSPLDVELDDERPDWIEEADWNNARSIRMELEK